MNKKGDKIISIYWFAILILVASGITIMVLTFYGYPYDIREIEANIMINKVADCLSSQGVLIDSLFKEDNSFNDDFDIEKQCHITFKVEDEYDWMQKTQYYVEIKFLDINSLNEISRIKQGNNNLIPDCELQEQKIKEGKEESKLPKCLRGKFYAEDKENKGYIIEILSIVLKGEKNVRRT